MYVNLSSTINILNTDYVFKQTVKRDVSTFVEVYVSDPKVYFCFRGMTAPSGPGPPHYRGFTITQTYTHSVGLLWICDQPDAETSILQHTALTRTDMHASGGIRTRNLSNRFAAGKRLRARGHWDRQPIKLCHVVQRNIKDETLTNILAKSRT